MNEYMLQDVEEINLKLQAEVSWVHCAHYCLLYCYCYYYYYYFFFFWGGGWV